MTMVRGRAAIPLGDNAGRGQVKLLEKLANQAIKEDGPIAQTGHVGHLSAKELVVLGGRGVLAAILGHSIIPPFVCVESG
jgi:hypothetical protein